MEVGGTLLLVSTFHCQILKVVTTGFHVGKSLQDQHLALDSIAMYKVENKCRSRFMARSCSCVRVFALSGRHLNKGTSLLGILSVTGFVHYTSRQLKNFLH